MTIQLACQLKTRCVGSKMGVASALLLATVAGSARAQTAWAGAVNGSWFDPTKWTAGVPVAGTATTLGLAGAYTASLQNNFGGTCGTLTISNPAAILNVFDNAQLTVNGNISNSGLIQISGPGAPGNDTRLTAGGSISIGGTGTLRLAALGNGDNNTAILAYTAAGNVLTNSAGHTIAGAGRVYTNITNNGVVNADVAGKYIIMLEQPKTNNATMTASGGGALQFRQMDLTQGASGACLSSNGSPVQFLSASVAGGTLNGAGTNSGIQYYGGNAVNSVTMTNLNAATDNSFVNIGAGGVVNNGTWTVSDPGAPGNFTRIQAAAASVTVGGTGTIRLQGVAGGNGDNDTAALYYTAAGNVLTNGASHSIKGYGRVFTNLVNNGTVNADVAGKYIVMMDQPKANNGTMTASNGGALLFRGITVTGNPTAQIISTDAASPVQFQGATMTGGGFNTSGTGVFQYFSGNTLSNLTVNGSHQITDNSFATIATDLVNNGNWTISSPTAPGNFTRMQAGGNVAINGTGTIRLQGVQGGNGDNDTASIYYTNAANVLTLGANQQVRGYGRVHANLVNNGTVNADNTPNNSGPANKGIILMEQPKTNNATITSSNGGWWHIRGITLTNNGTLTSANTTTQVGGGFENCTVNGGTISNLGNLFFGAYATVNIHGSTITPGSGLQVNDNSALNTTGLTNNGTILVSAPTAPGNFTRLQAAAAATTLAGTGTIRLQGVQGGNGDNNSASIYYTIAANVLTLGANQQLRGYGRVHANIVNNGTINADNTPNNSGPANKGIILMEQPKTNNATITSSNAGFWYVRGITLTNGPSGILSSTNTTTGGGGFENCTVVGGTISNVANQFFGIAGIVTLNGATITPGSGVQVNDNSMLKTTGLTNNGTINIQKVGGPGNLTRLTAAANNATIAGTGTVRLNSVNNQAGNDTAYIQTDDAVNFTGILGPNQTLAGIGRVYHKWNLQGPISPGQTATGSGEIQCHGGAVAFSPTTKCIVHANGSGVSGNYDRLTGGSTKVVDGQLIFSFEGGYSPTIGDKYDIVVGPFGGVTGEFDSVTAPSPFGRIRVLYLEDRVRLSLCYADCDGDGALTIDDFICFQTQFALGDKQSDCDEDGFLSIDDFICYQTYFAIGC